MADLLICSLVDDPLQPGLPAPLAGGSGGCLPLDTQVYLADGSTIPIGEIDLGDEVLACAFGSLEIVSRSVVGLLFHEAEALCEFEEGDGTTLRCSLDQSLGTAFGPVKAPYLSADAELLTLSPNRDRVSSEKVGRRSTRELAKPTDVASLDLGGEFFFFVGPSRRAGACHISITWESGGRKRKM